MNGNVTPVIQTITGTNVNANVITALAFKNQLAGFNDPANAYLNSLTVIRITNGNPGKFKAAKDGRFGSKGTLVTGSEPWNVVI